MMTDPTPQGPPVGQASPGGRDPLTNEQLAGLYGPLPKREVPYLLTLEGRPALWALIVLLLVLGHFLSGS